MKTLATSCTDQISTSQSAPMSARLAHQKALTASISVPLERKRQPAQLLLNDVLRKRTRAIGAIEDKATILAASGKKICRDPSTTTINQGLITTQRTDRRNDTDVQALDELLSFENISKTLLTDAYRDLSAATATSLIGSTTCRDVRSTGPDTCRDPPSAATGSAHSSTGTETVAWECIIQVDQTHIRRMMLFSAMLLLNITEFTELVCSFPPAARMKHEVVVDFVVDIYTLYNFYLDGEGLYQVRASMQGDSRYYPQVLLGPTKRLNGTYVTKTFFITRTCDSIQTDLNEAVRFEVHLFLKDDVRVRLLDAIYELRLEIWCSKTEDEDSRSAVAKPPPPFTAVTARVLTLTFDPVRGLHHYYPLVFEVSNLSVLTMTVHAALTTICIPGDRSMRNASVSHIVGQFCMCDGQNSCCYSTTVDKTAQQDLNSLLTQTASHLRKILEEHKRTPAVSRKSRYTNIGSDAGSERARSRISRYSTLDRPEAIRFPDEESKKLSVILVVLWEQYLEAVVGHPELRSVLYEPLQRERTARLCEGYVILNKDSSAVFYDGLVGHDTYRQLTRKVRASNYLKRLPVLEIECWPLDGNQKNTPIIFEERYRPLVSPPPVDEEGDSGVHDDVAELLSVHSLTAGSMELLALSTHPESEVCNCRRQFRATNFRFRRPSAVSLPPALSELYQNADSGCYRIDNERLNDLRKGLWESLKIPVAWSTPDVSELLALNSPQAKAPKSESLHLIVLVHGMYGCSTDLRLLRVFLELAQPCSNVRFLMSRANEREETFRDFDTLGVRLATEVVDHINKHSKKPVRISFIGFSMGNIIIRAALTKAPLQPLLPHMHTFLSLSGPHVGTVFNTSVVINMGLWYLHRFENTESLRQMMLADSPDIRKTFLYRLSQDAGLTNFKNVILLGSADDYIVPLHSAHIKLAKHITKDATPQGLAYREMVRNILQPIMDKPDMNLIRLEVHVPYRASLISSNVHVAPLDCEILVQKIVTVACARHLL